MYDKSKPYSVRMHERRPAALLGAAAASLPLIRGASKRLRGVRPVRTRFYSARQIRKRKHPRYARATRNHDLDTPM